MPVGEMSVTSSEFQWAGWEAAANSYSACTQPYAAAQTFFWMLTWLFFLYAGWRRIQMRRRFGLPGDDVRDYITWLACPVCALCQETRTLAVNRCDGGVWHGPRGTQTGAPGMQAFPGGGLPQLPQAPPSYGQAPQAWAPQPPLAQQQGAQLPPPPPSYGEAQAGAPAQEGAAAAPLSQGVPQGMYVPPRGEHAA
jgi:Cys-rich protein (TIGR01571 family)